MDILVFPDGETFNTVEGCTLRRVPDGLEIEQVEDLLAEEKGELIANVKDLVAIGEKPARSGATRSTEPAGSGGGTATSPEVLPSSRPRLPPSG